MDLITVLLRVFVSMRGPNKAAAQFISLQIHSDALQIGIAAGLDAALCCTTALFGEPVLKTAPDAGEAVDKYDDGPTTHWLRKRPRREH